MISIIILCRNYEQYLKQAVDSATAQTFKNCELIVLHDSCEKPFQQDHPQGEARMRNIGADRAQGEYLLYLDADDWIEPDYLEKAFALIDHNTIVSCWAQFFGQSNYLFKQDKFSPKDFLKENRVHISSLLPKKAWREVGGFDQRAPGLPDWEFWIRVAHRGYQFKMIPEALFHYRIHDNSESKRANKKGTQVIDYIKRKHKDKYEKL